MGQDTTRAQGAGALRTESLNRITLVGRVSAEPQVRTLPSDDELVTFRLIVTRPPDRNRADASSRTKVDVIDIACWSARTRRTAARLEPDAVVQVEGALRRRFFQGGGGPASRYEVEAASVRRFRG